MLKIEILEDLIEKSFKSLKRSAKELTFLALFGISASYLRAQDWHLQYIEGPADIGQTSIALYNDEPRIVYEFKNDQEEVFLKYTFLSNQEWRQEIPNTGPLGEFGGSPDLGLDSMGYPHIAYYDQNNGYIREVFLDSTSTWQNRAIDYIGEVNGENPKIGMDQNDNTNIVYLHRDPNHDINALLKNATYIGPDPDDWNIDIIDTLSTSGLEYYDLALDNNSIPHVVYQYFRGQNDELRYAAKDGSTWEIDTIIRGHTLYALNGTPSITCDSNDEPKPHVSFSQEDSLKYAHLEDDLWIIENAVIDTASWMGSYSSIDLDNNYYPHIEYYGGRRSNMGNNPLKYVYYDGSDWKTEIIDYNTSSSSPASLVLSNNQSHSSYIHTEYIGGEWVTDLRYSTRFPLTGIEDEVTNTLPKSFSLSQNYPNPFNPITTMNYTIPQEYSDNVSVSLNIYNIRGQHVKTLEDSVKEPGSYLVKWDGTNKNNEKVGSGVYLYTLTLDDEDRNYEERATKKMVLLK